MTRKRHGVCVRCGEYFMDGEEPYICNRCKEEEIDYGKDNNSV